MTAGNNGAGTPENDDPFAYLYRSEGGEDGAQGAAGDGGPARRPGVPRTSYNHVRAVGQRQYGQGQQATQQAPAYPQQQQPYGQQSAHYAAPETLPGGDRGPQGPPAGPGMGGPEPRRNRNGLLIAAIAVVAVVCVGIAVAMVTNSGNDDKDQAGQPGPSASQEQDGGQATQKPSQQNLPKADAGSLHLEGNATTATDVPGARSSNHTYVGNITQPGDGATWTFDVPKSGQYTLYVDYGVPGKDADSTLTVNGQASSRPLNMKNFAGAKEGDWEHGWTQTYAYVNLNKGTNDVKISCESGNHCGFNLDKVWVKSGQAG